MATTPNVNLDATATAFGASLAGILTKHKQQTISIKAARSWQFRTKRGVNDSWAKIAKKKSLGVDASMSSLGRAPEDDAGSGTEGSSSNAHQARKVQYEKRKADEEARAKELHKKIVGEVSRYDMDDSVTFDELFAREVVKAVDSLRTRAGTDSESSDEEDHENDGKASKGKTVWRTAEAG